uniref:NADH dehydrogenase subunit 6 n=1 Tax=Parasagitta elegans TaxID=1562708 RepID=A0A141CLJ1_9BILA|nr:NADH dehydrogenase subunit 6 [Parasagitta elegans]
MLGFMFVLVSSPFAAALLFVMTLLLVSVMVGAMDSFLGLIIFIVYLGGALVLFSYCFMLTPLQNSKDSFPTLLLTITFVGANSPLLSQGAVYEFYWVSSLLLSVGLLLFIVMLCVVALIDFSQGSMRVV